jgi:hypothetical protein
MDKIHFVVGPVGSGRKPVVSRLLVTLKEMSEGSISKLAIGSFRSTKVEELATEKWKNYCINQIESHLDMFAGKEHHIITGPLLAVHIVEVFKRFPNSSLYLVKSTDEDLYEDALSHLEEILIDRDTVNKYNSAVMQQLTQLQTELSLIWNHVEAPIISHTGAINFVETPENPKIMMATYNV